MMHNHQLHYTSYSDITPHNKTIKSKLHQRYDIRHTKHTVLLVDICNQGDINQTKEGQANMTNNMYIKQITTTVLHHKDNNQDD